MKTFNTTGACVPEKNYMVDLSSRLDQIKAMVDAGAYFTINRARQYGKTTTLTALIHLLRDHYDVLSLDLHLSRPLSNPLFDLSVGKSSSDFRFPWVSKRCWTR